MNAQITDRLFADAFIMMSFDITFEGVKTWFNMAGFSIDDTTLFRTLLLPEYFPEEQQAELLRMIVYRYEDVFFQANRSSYCDKELVDETSDTFEPVHQLLLRMMNKRTLYGENNALLDLYVILQEDKQRDHPQYATLHSLFDRKWDKHASV